VHAPAVSASACAAQVGDTNGMNGGAHADGLNGGWKTNSVKPPVKAGGAAPSPAPGGVLNVEAAAERLRHTYAPGKRTWFFWTIIILAANGGLLLGAPRLRSPPRGGAALAAVGGRGPGSPCLSRPRACAARARGSAAVANMGGVACHTSCLGQSAWLRRRLLPRRARAAPSALKGAACARAQATTTAWCAAACLRPARIRDSALGGQALP